MTYVNLTHVQFVPEGVAVASTPVAVQGVTYMVPTPETAVTGSAVVFPVLEADEETNSVRIRLDLWRAGSSRGKKRRQLLLDFADMATAVRAAQEFEADPGIDWDSSREDHALWATAFVDRERARRGGGR